MGDVFYNFVRGFGIHIFWVTSRPVVLHLERLHRPGAFIVASNHQSPFDVALLIRHAKRHLDFVSVTEVFRNRFVAWFYGHMNAFPLDRSKPDSPTVRVILDRLNKGRVVAMFPEGRITPLKDSVVVGGRLRPGVGRIAQLTGAPVVPVVIINSIAYARRSAWIPRRRIRYGLIVGEPLIVRTDLDKAEAAKVMEADLKSALMGLYEELTTAMAR